MIRPAKTIVLGLTDPRQALEVGLLGVDAVVVQVGGAGPCALEPVAATAVATVLPPLAIRLAWLPAGGELPPGFHGAVTAPEAPVPVGAGLRIVRIDAEFTEFDPLPDDARAAWVPPRVAGTSSATRFDFARIERLSRRVRPILEIPDGAGGVETAIRLGRPYAVLFADAVWFRPGIIDLDRLEKALGVVARLNKGAFD